MEKNEMRPVRLIPCLLLPVLAAVLFAAVNLTGLFDGVLSRLAGSGFGLDFVFVVFPALVLLIGILPAVLLVAKEQKVWAVWSAVFFAAFFAAYIFLLSRGDNDPPHIFFLMWLMLAPCVILCHLLPSWIVSAFRRLREGKMKKSR